MIDTHTHLYDQQLVSDLPAIINSCQTIGIEAVYMPNLDLATIKPMLAIEEAYHGFCYAMLGLHPCSVNKEYPDTLAAMRPWLNQHPFIAIGEIGLDFYWSSKYKLEQIQALEEQLSWAKEENLPVVLHARNSLDEVIQVVQKSGVTRGVFHCFTGNLEQAIEITKMGFFLGIGGIITFEKSHLPAVIQAIDLQYLLLETDSPYLAPVPYRGKRNTPCYLPAIADAIAAIKQVPTALVRAQTSRQARQLFSSKKK
ncbi:MAG: TatD family hydrolase [Bacteroidota bacterium]